MQGNAANTINQFIMNTTVNENIMLPVLVCACLCAKLARVHTMQSDYLIIVAKYVIIYMYMYVYALYVLTYIVNIH